MVCRQRYLKVLFLLNRRPNYTYTLTVVRFFP